MSVIGKPTCPADCAELDIIFGFDECAPEFESGEIDRVYVAKASYAGFTEVEDLAEWTAALGTDIQEMKVIGDKPEPEVAEIPWVDGQSIQGDKKHSLNFRVLETSSANYEFLRQADCNNLYKFWYRSSGGRIYGGNAGLVAAFRGRYMIPEDRGDIAKIMYTTKWTDRTEPDRSNAVI
jgi:hypothetical protein